MHGFEECYEEISLGVARELGLVGDDSCHQVRRAFAFRRILEAIHDLGDVSEGEELADVERLFAATVRAMANREKAMAGWIMTDSCWPSAAAAGRSRPSPRQTAA